MEQVLANAGVIEAGGYEDEHAHQLRIGLRRLRTAIRELAEFNADIDVRWEPVLAHAFRALGVGRDRQVMEQGLQRELAGAGAPELPAPSWRDATDARAIVRAPEFRSALLCIAAFAQSPTAADAAAFDGAPLDALRPRLDELHRSIKRAAKRFVKLSPEDQHRVRKRLKRLRYLAEFAGPLFRRKRVEAYLKRLEPAQDALGRLNDCKVALAAHRAAVGDAPGKWFAIGWLEAARRACVSDAARALAGAVRAERFWRGR